MWKVVNLHSVTPHYEDLGQYINGMDKAGWELKHVDQGNLFFRKKDSK